jgi:hypothetical protein
MTGMYFTSILKHNKHMKNKLKIWLKKNELTPDPNDFVAVVSSMGSVNREDIINAIMDEGIELKRETVTDVIGRFHRHSGQFVLNGYNVNTGMVYMRSVVSGSITGKKVDPEKNRVYVAVMQGAELRREIADTTVEILGEMPDVIDIQQVTNLLTKEADGTLSRGRNARIDGSYIKVAGDDPAVGVYLVNTADNFETKLEPEDIVTNSPSSIIILVPALLAEGSFRLKIVTQFTGANKLLKAPRTAIFHQELVVV